MHFSLRRQPRFKHEASIEFECEYLEIGPTHRKSVTVIHDTNQRFWVVESHPNDVLPHVLGQFTL